MKNKEKFKKVKRENRHHRIRSRVSGDAEKPRLSVFRSNDEIYASLIDDQSGKVLLSLSSRKVVDDDIKEIKKMKDIPKENFRRQIESFATGYLLAKQAKKKGISKTVFDRGGYIYTGRVRSLAEGARSGGLEF